MVEVVANPSSLNRSAMGSISGQIFLQSESAAFPADGWYDFPVVILAWWIEGLTKVVNGRTDSFEGLFMDGPFAFEIQGGDDMSGRISWGRRGEETPIGIVHIDALLRSAVAAGRVVADSCRKQNWSGRDLEQLERVLLQAA